ncbi:MAG TPA: FecR family protein [Spirochaetota bacterium]|nr:FecR family protein [Spirochaetota bacterium]
MKKITGIFIFVFLISCGKSGEIKTVITAFSGPVKVNSISLTAAGTAIKPGDIIETGDKSFCDIMINEKNILRIKENSRLVLHVTATDSFLKLEKGWLGGITRAKFTEEGKYKINTPTVAAAIRGTSFCVKVEDEKNTYFCVCNGTINLAEAGKESGEDVTASHHAAKRFTRDADGSIKTDSNPGLLYHTDEGVEEMAAMINEKIDWTRPD